MASGAIALALLLSACNTPTKAVESAAQLEQAEATAEQEAEAELKSNVIRQKSTVTKKGTNISAIVNGQAITNYDVQRRVAFLKLRRVSGNRNDKALEELVEQNLKLQEANLRGTRASDTQVDGAFANFAKSNRMSTNQLGNMLGQSGVSIGHFKEFIRGQMSWSRTVQGKFRSDTVSKSTSDAIFQIRKEGGEKPTSNEYLLEQTIFVVPAGSSKSVISQRRTEALAFKSTFTKCGETITKAAGLRDVTVRTLPRSLELQLPPNWKDEISKLDEGQTTKIQNTDKGVEFIAVCSKKLVSDDNVAIVTNQQSEFDKFNESSDQAGADYLAELKSKAKIIYR
ncbi:MAG: SurA N-terminal domain-containing protein [Salaquimonas sp.]